MITAGAALFVLDVAVVLVVWPILLWMVWPERIAILDQPIDIWVFHYPVIDLLVLYAMGLYRREAILETRNSLIRVPLVVGMGAAIGLILTILLPALNP